GYHVRFANEYGLYEGELEIIPEDYPGLVLSLIEENDSNVYFFGTSTHDLYFLDFGTWNEQKAFIKREMGTLVESLGLDINLDEISYGDYDFATLDHEMRTFFFFVLLGAVVLMGISAFYRKGILIENLYRNDLTTFFGFALTFVGMAPVLLTGTTMLLGGIFNICTSICFVVPMIIVVYGVILLRRSIAGVENSKPPSTTST
ncbi:MAG: hypothetical protein JSV43_00710, partial [Methanobacteriota archaeon]